MRLQELLMYRFFTRRARPANGEQTKPPPKAKENEECDFDPDVSPVLAFLHWYLNTMRCQCSANIMPGTAESKNDKCKQREEPVARTQTLSTDDFSSSDKFDSNKSWAFRKSLIRAREKDSSRKSQARMMQDTSPEVVEVYAARGFQVTFSYRVCTFVLTTYGNNRDMSHTSERPALILPQHMQVAPVMTQIPSRTRAYKAPGIRSSTRYVSRVDTTTISTSLLAALRGLNLHAFIIFWFTLQICS
jgi:hypothetical protein